SIDFYSMNVRLERREEVLFTSLVPRSVVRWIEPELELRGRRKRLGDSPLFLTLESSLGYYRRGEVGADYGRFDFYPVLSSQVSTVPWLDLDASLGARETYYSKSQLVDTSGPVPTTTFVDEPFNRQYYQ